MAPKPKKPPVNNSVSKTVFGVNDWSKKDALRQSTRTRKMTDAQYEAEKNRVAKKAKTQGAGALTQAERDAMTGGVRQSTSLSGYGMGNAPTRNDVVQQKLKENRGALTTATDVATMVGGGGFSAAKGAAGLVKGAVAAGRAAVAPRAVALAATGTTRAATKGMSGNLGKVGAGARTAAANKISKAAESAVAAEAKRPAGMASARTLAEQRARDLAAKQAQGKISNLTERDVKRLMRPDVLGAKQPAKALMPARGETIAKGLAGEVKTTGKMPVRADFNTAKEFNAAMKQYKANVKTISPPKPKAPVSKKVSTTPAKPEPVKPVEPAKPSNEAVLVSTPTPKSPPRIKTGKRVSTNVPAVRRPSTDLVVQAKPPAVREPLTANTRVIPGTGGPVGAPAAAARSVGGAKAMKAIGAGAKPAPKVVTAAAKAAGKDSLVSRAARSAGPLGISNLTKNQKRVIVGAAASGALVAGGAKLAGSGAAAADAKPEKDGKYRDKWGREITKSEADHRERWWQQNKNKDEKTFTKAYEAELARRDKWRKTTGAKSLGEAASTITRNQDVPGGISPKFWRALSADQQQKLKAKYAGSKNKRFGAWRSSIGKQDIKPKEAAPKPPTQNNAQKAQGSAVSALTPKQKQKYEYLMSLGSVSPQEALRQSKLIK